MGRDGPRPVAARICVDIVSTASVASKRWRLPLWIACSSFFSSSLPFRMRVVWSSPLCRTASLLILLAWGIGLSAADATAQSAPDSTAPTAVVTADRDGFRIGSPDGRFALHIRGDVQIDGRFFPEGAPFPGASTFDVRRVRTAFNATLDRRFRVQTMVDFGNGNARLQDAFVDLRATDAVTVRVGRFKVPVGLEFIQSPGFLFFAERAYPSDVVPRRDVGALLNASLGPFTIDAGLTNGVVDGRSGNLDFDSGKDVVGRVYVEPFDDGSLLDDAGIGVGATHGLHRGSVDASRLPTFASRGGQTVFAYRSGAFANGRVTRISPQAYVPVGPVGFMVEAVQTQARVDTRTRSATLTHRSWQASASVSLTGDDATFGRLVPRRPFAPKRGQWGAVDLVGRVQQLRFDDDAFPSFAAPDRTADRVTAWGVGLNWTLTAHARVSLNVEQTRATTPGDVRLLDTETLVTSRVQLVF